MLSRVAYVSLSVSLSMLLLSVWCVCCCLCVALLLCCVRGVPGQRGTNHINLRENSWVIAKLDALGYDYLEQHSKQTRKAVQDKKSLVW